MNYFWDQDVPYIDILGIDYLFYITLMAVLLFLIITNVEYIRENRETIRIWLLGISIVQQIGLYSWYIFETGFDIGESLPLHISRISSILGIIYLITKNKKVIDVLFYFGLFAYGSFFLSIQSVPSLSSNGHVLFYQPCHYHFIADYRGGCVRLASNA